MHQSIVPRHSLVLHKTAKKRDFFSMLVSIEPVCAAKSSLLKILPRRQENCLIAAEARSIAILDNFVEK
jgi:hypothetical protein